jgi:hypothetical protein
MQLFTGNTGEKGVESNHFKKILNPIRGNSSIRIIRDGRFLARIYNCMVASPVNSYFVA